VACRAARRCTELREEDDKLATDLLEHGIAPAVEGRPPELVVIEADGTMLRAQRDGQTNVKLRTAASYHGKIPAGGRPQKRLSLQGKRFYATTAPTRQFGRAIAVDGVAKDRLNRVKHILACHDGEDEFGLVFRAWFPTGRSINATNGT